MVALCDCHHHDLLSWVWPRQWKTTVWEFQDTWPGSAWAMSHEYLICGKESWASWVAACLRLFSTSWSSPVRYFEEPWCLGTRAGSGWVSCSACCKAYIVELVWVLPLWDLLCKLTLSFLYKHGFWWPLLPTLCPLLLHQGGQAYPSHLRPLSAS